MSLVWFQLVISGKYTLERSLVKFSGKPRSIHCWTSTGKQKSGGVQLLQVNFLLTWQETRVDIEASNCDDIKLSCRAITLLTLLHRQIRPKSSLLGLFVALTAPCGLARRRAKGKASSSGEQQGKSEYLSCLPASIGLLSKFKRRCMIYIQSVYQVTVHELLHLLGLDHCIYFACLMNGSGSLEEDHRHISYHIWLHISPDY